MNTSLYHNRSISVSTLETTTSSTMEFIPCSSSTRNMQSFYHSIIQKSVPFTVFYKHILDYTTEECSGLVCNAVIKDN